MIKIRSRSSLRNLPFRPPSRISPTAGYNFSRPHTADDVEVEELSFEGSELERKLDLEVAAIFGAEDNLEAEPVGLINGDIPAAVLPNQEVLVNMPGGMVVTLCRQPPSTTPRPTPTPTPSLVSTKKSLSLDTTSLDTIYMEDELSNSVFEQPTHGADQNEDLNIDDQPKAMVTEETEKQDQPSETGKEHDMEKEHDKEPQGHKDGSGEEKQTQETKNKEDGVEVEENEKQLGDSEGQVENEEQESKKKGGGENVEKSPDSEPTQPVARIGMSEARSGKNKQAEKDLQEKGETINVVVSAGKGLENFSAFEQFQEFLESEEEREDGREDPEVELFEDEGLGSSGGSGFSIFFSNGISTTNSSTSSSPRPLSSSGSPHSTSLPIVSSSSDSSFPPTSSPPMMVPLASSLLLARSRRDRLLGFPPR